MKIKYYKSSDSLYNHYTRIYRGIDWTIRALLFILLISIILYVLPIWETDIVQDYLRKGFNFLGLFALTLNIIKFFFDIYKTKRVYLETNPFDVNILVKKESGEIELSYKSNSRFFKKSLINERGNNNEVNNQVNVVESDHIISNFSLPLLNKYTYEVIFIFESLFFGIKYIKSTIYLSNELIETNKFKINNEQFDIMQS